MQKKKKYSGVVLESDLLNEKILDRAGRTFGIAQDLGSLEIKMLAHKFALVDLKQWF